MHRPAGRVERALKGGPVKAGHKPGWIGRKEQASWKVSFGRIKVGSLHAGLLILTGLDVSWVAPLSVHDRSFAKRSLRVRVVVGRGVHADRLLLGLNARIWTIVIVEALKRRCKVDASRSKVAASRCI